jgi:hypothetical protein
VLNKYQPGRPDLLINTDWGIPCDGLTTGEAQSRGMLLFHNRWVTKEEKKQLQDERNAYASIRVIGYLLLFICVPVLINIRSIAEGGITHVAFAVFYAFAASVTGSGLIRYARYARYPTILIFLSFFVLPFTPLLEDEKGAPLLFILGMAGLYYFLRKTARKILWLPVGPKPDQQKDRPVGRKIIYGIAIVVGLWAGYFIYDWTQASQMSADVCHRAAPGMPLEEFLSKFSEGDYKIIRRPESVMIVPKRGMGRNHCMVIHDGRIIAGAKPGFMD